jgi:outer membrane protein assembly factor BamD
LREEALYYKFLSSYELAINSVIGKKLERLKSVDKVFNNIKRYYPETIFETQLNEKIEIIKNEIKLLN